VSQVSKNKTVQSIVELASLHGVQDVLLSPGSRNAPLIISFDASDSFRCLSVLDERSAGFIALGMAQQTRKPVILCCTSGSAVLNYAPALAEAYYQRVPLVVITTDRPPQWIDQGEGQTIRQVGALDAVVEKCFALELDSDDTLTQNQQKIDAAFALAVESSRPVQINVPLDEPLYDFEDGLPLGLSIAPNSPDQSELSVTEMDDYETMWNGASRILILVTQHNQPEEIRESLARLSKDPRVVIVTETNANLYQMDYVSCIDRTLAAFQNHDAEQDYIPDLLITLGHNIISKKFRAFIRKHGDSVLHHWQFGREQEDTFLTLTHHISVSANRVLSRLSVKDGLELKPFGALWKSAFFRNEQGHQAFLSSAPYSDLKVFESILDLVPPGAVFQMGNSSVVRYVQLFNQIRDISYFGNRGVSGIEGCTSTAVGSALANKSMHLFVSGDQAFRYDSNALALVKEVPNLKIIVVNNGGGNIFRIIPGPTNHRSSDAFIEKKDNSTMERWAAASGVVYLSASSLEEFEEAAVSLFATTECTMLEVFTPSEVSPEVLANYFNFLSP